METLCSFPKEDGAENNKRHQGTNIKIAQIKEEEESRTDLEGLKRNNIYLEQCSADQIDTIIRWRFLTKISSKNI